MVQLLGHSAFLWYLIATAHYRSEKYVLCLQALENCVTDIDRRLLNAMNSLSQNTAKARKTQRSWTDRCRFCSPLASVWLTWIAWMIACSRDGGRAWFQLCGARSERLQEGGNRVASDGAHRRFLSLPSPLHSLLQQTVRVFGRHEHVDSHTEHGTAILAMDPQSESLCAIQHRVDSGRTRKLPESYGAVASDRGAKPIFRGSMATSIDLNVPIARIWCVVYGVESS